MGRTRFCRVKHRPSFSKCTTPPYTVSSSMLVSHVNDSGRLHSNATSLVDVTSLVTHMSNYDPIQLAFLDETLKDERTPDRQFGRARKGTRAQKRGPFVRRRCVTIEA